MLLGTDGLGDEGAETVAGGSGEVETLYLGCNGITAGGACRIADQLRASPQVVTGVWLKRNPLGSGGGRAAAELIASARSLRTLDLVQTGLDPAGVTVLADALLAAADNGRRIERLFIGGNPLGAEGAVPLAAVIAAGAIDELYVSAAQLGDTGALLLAEALERAPYGRLVRLSVASNGIGPRAAARLVMAATAAGVALLDLGRVRAAAVLGAAGRQPRRPARRRSHRRGPRGRRAPPQPPRPVPHRDAQPRGPPAPRHGTPRAHPTRFVLGQGIAASIKRRLETLTAHVPDRRSPPTWPPSAACTARRGRGEGEHGVSDAPDR